MKLVINCCYGGFSVSKEVYESLNLDWDGFGFIELERNDPRLVEAVEKLKDRANGHGSNLKIVDIPNDVDWYIDDYDGIEIVREKHRSWQ